MCMYISIDSGLAEHHNTTPGPMQVYQVQKKLYTDCGTLALT